MENPYMILGLQQNAEKQDILKAQIIAMKEKKYSLPEISAATKQLLNPSKRLAADFMFPARIKAKRIMQLDLPGDTSDVSIMIDRLNPDAMDSL